MAAELQVVNNSGTATYALVRNAVGQIWNGVAFEAYVTANYANYPINLTEQGSASGYFTGSFPSTTAGVYGIVYKTRAGGSPAESDATIAIEDAFQWSGIAVVANSDAATSGQVGMFLPQRIFRGQMLQNFPFSMVSSADHVTPFTSGIISGQISRDGGAFGPLQSGTAVAGYGEVGLGMYKVSLTSGDLNCNTAALVFQGTGISGGSADQRSFTLVMNRTSGQTVT